MQGRRHVVTEELKSLIEYFNAHNYILPEIICYFSWKSRTCTPVEAVLFWRSIPEDEKSEYVFAIHDALYEIRMGYHD